MTSERQTQGAVGEKGCDWSLLSYLILACEHVRQREGFRDIRTISVRYLYDI